VESDSNSQVDRMIEKMFMQTIEHDLHAFQSGAHDEHSVNKKLLLLHLFIQLYQDSPPKQTSAADNQIDEVTQKIDALQKQADALIDDME